MDYLPDEWPLLVSEIERQGGAMLPDFCLGSIAKFSSPNATRVTRVKTCHCHKDGDTVQTMFVSTYTPSDDEDESQELRERGAGFVRACAVCDSAGQWPRFEDFADKLGE